LDKRCDNEAGEEHQCCGSCEFFVPAGVGIEGTEDVKKDGLCNEFDAEVDMGDVPMTETCYSEV
jgi:hypothetical protein